MIGHLSGKLIAVTPSGSVVSAGGVGYLVNVSADTPVGADLELWISTIVREDAITLYGFNTLDDQLVFNSLRSVTGVGPAQSMALLRGLGGHGVRSAVLSSDAKALSAVKGVGPKVAERIVSMVRLAPPAADALPVTVVLTGHALAVQALTSLGFSEAVAKDAVSDALATQQFSSSDDDVAQLVTAALGRI